MTTINNFPKKIALNDAMGSTDKRMRKVFAKAGITLLIIVSTLVEGYTQCSYNNFLSPFNSDLTPAGEGLSDSYSCAWAGDYFTLNVVDGAQYLISTCNTVNAVDPIVTLYNSSGTTVLATNDNFCGSYAEITYNANFTGTVHILIDQMPSCVHSSVCIDIMVTHQAGVPMKLDYPETNRNEKETEISEFSVFPNPARNQVVVRIPDMTEATLPVKIVDVLGNEQLRTYPQNIDNTIHLNIAPGMYFVYYRNQIRRLEIW